MKEINLSEANLVHGGNHPHPLAREPACTMAVGFTTLSGTMYVSYLSKRYMPMAEPFLAYSFEFAALFIGLNLCDRYVITQEPYLFAEEYVD